jgi:HEXXH motif-containing protein
MSGIHKLTRESFELLGGGGGSADAVAELRSAQLSKHLLLIRHLLDHWPTDDAGRDTVVDALDRARAADPGRFREILSSPLIGAWAAIAVRAVKHGKASWAEFGHLSALAVAACQATGAHASAEVPVRNGSVAIPGLGAVSVGTEYDRVRLETTDGRLTVTSGSAVEIALNPSAAGAVPVQSAGWRPVRHLDATHADQRLRVGLDDLDPYRHGHHAPPALRLPADEVERWQAVFSDAWQLLAGHLPERAAELSAGLRTLVPLVQTDERTARSATLRHAFGVFGLTRPPSAADFAVTLVHEFQHSKLSAIIDLLPLTDPDDRGRYFAPWRTDPRPLAGLLQGVYAFVGVADTWRALREVPDLRQAAVARFAEARLQVDRGLTAIEESGALTTDGSALVARLRLSTDSMLAESVPAAVAREAEETLELIRRHWVKRNMASA